MIELYIQPREGASFPWGLEGKPIKIGRSADNDIVLADPFSSGCHAVIFPTAGGYAVDDRGSKNGTYVNGRRISGPVDLTEGDEILVGSTRISFGREFRTRVEVVEGVAGQGGLNTIINVRDIVGQKKTSVSRVLAPEAGPSGAEQRFPAIICEVSQALIYHMPVDKLMEHIMDLLTGVIPMDRAVLMLREGKEKELTTKVVRIKNADLRNRNIQVSRTIINTVLEKNQAILISDIGSSADFRSQASVIKSEISSAVCVPLWNNERIIGLIYGDRTSLVDHFTEDDLRLLTLLANLAAVKYENAKLTEESIEKARMEKELTLASQIQRNFLPKGDPDFKPYDINGRAVTCCHVGGDYYDFIKAGPDSLLLVIADVSGTGVSSALLMASLRAALRTEDHPWSDLAALAARLNDFVHQSSEPGFFISFFIGVLDRASGEMTYVNAGHNPPYLVNPGRKSETLDSTGFCLGMFPGVKFGTGKAVIERGGLLLLYTDGVVEQRDPAGEEYGYERLAEFLEKNMGLSACDIIAELIGDVYGASCCVVPGDDLTMVAVKRPG